MKTPKVDLQYPGKISISYNRLYVPSILGRVSFPHRDPNTLTYLATDCKYIFYIESGHKYSPIEKRLVPIGIPYGIYPRLLISLITTYAVYNKLRKIKLADNMSRFIRSLGYSVTGGKNGTITQLNRQLEKLLNCRICIAEENVKENKIIRSQKFISPVNEIEIWESIDKEDESPNPVMATLSESFYKQILKTAFPVDHKTVEALRSSLLALDLYFFLCGRTFRLKGKDAYISWSELEKQLGSNYKRTDLFVQKAKLAIDKIKKWYPQLNVRYKPGVLIISKTSEPHIKKVIH